METERPTHNLRLDHRIYLNTQNGHRALVARVSSPGLAWQMARAAASLYSADTSLDVYRGKDCVSTHVGYKNTGCAFSVG